MSDQLGDRRGHNNLVVGGVMIMTTVIVDGIIENLPALAADRLVYSFQLQGFEVVKQNECYYVFDPQEVFCDPKRAKELSFFGEK